MRENRRTINLNQNQQPRNRRHLAPHCSQQPQEGQTGTPTTDLDLDSMQAWDRARGLSFPLSCKLGQILDLCHLPHFTAHLPLQQQQPGQLLLTPQQLSTLNFTSLTSQEWLSLETHCWDCGQEHLQERYPALLEGSNHPHWRSRGGRVSQIMVAMILQRIRQVIDTRRRSQYVLKVDLTTTSRLLSTCHQWKR